jgi:hypothetical protein
MAPQAFMYPFFEYTQENELFGNFLDDPSQRLENKITQLFSTSVTDEQMITMPYDRFDMISAGSLDNSGDLFEDDKSCMSNNKLFSIESFFNGASKPSPESHEKQEESTLDHISSSGKSNHSSSLGLKIQQCSAKTEESTFWLQSPTLRLPKVDSNSDQIQLKSRLNVNGF